MGMALLLTNIIKTKMSDVPLTLTLQNNELSEDAAEPGKKPTKRQPAKAKAATAAAKKATTTKKATSSKGSTEEESADAGSLPKKQTATRGKRGKAVVLDSSSDDSDSAMLSSKKPAAAKGKTLKVRIETFYIGLTSKLPFQDRYHYLYCIFH